MLYKIIKKAGKMVTQFELTKSHLFDKRSLRVMNVT